MRIRILWGPLLIACDPGASGGFVIVDDRRTQKLLGILPGKVHARTFTKRVQECLERYCEKGEKVICVIEDVHGVRGQSNKDTFTFGWWTGRCHNLLEIVSGEYVREMAPQEWMRYLNVPSSAEKDRKNFIRDKMTFFFRDFGALPLWASDAAGLAWAYMKKQGCIAQMSV